MAKKKSAKKKSASKKTAKKKSAAKKTAKKKSAAKKESAAKSKATGGSGRKRRASTFRGKKKVYYERLMELQQQLVEEAEGFTDSAFSYQHEAGEELADVGSDNFARSMALDMLTVEEKRVALIQEALERLENGDYGDCTHCGATISEGRLEALPHAKLCIDCKSRHEEQVRRGLISPDDDVIE